MVVKAYVDLSHFSNFQILPSYYFSNRYMNIAVEFHCSVIKTKLVFQLRTSYFLWKKLLIKIKTVLRKCSYKKFYCKYAVNYRRALMPMLTLAKHRHPCSPVNLLYISRTPFLKNTSGGLLL